MKRSSASARRGRDARCSFLVLLAAAALAWTGCRSPAIDPEVYVRSPDRPEAIPTRDLDDLRRARDAWDRGDLAAAEGILERVASDQPDDVGIAVLLQEVAFLRAGPVERERKIEEARERAEAEPTAVHLLLAARIEPDSERCREWMLAALAAEPRNAWVRYALAHFETQAGNWVAAGKRLEQTLAIDPGHRAARRLEAALLARAGDKRAAIDALETWIAQTKDDPRVSAATRANAKLDLAHLLVVSHEDERAREVLLGLVEDESSETRRACLLAAAELGLGNTRASLTAAREAQESDPGSITPLVQEALLLQHHVGNREAARAAWERVLGAVEGNPGLSALIQGLRARVVLERMEARAAAPSRSPKPRAP